MQQFDKQRARGTQGFGLFDGQFGNIVRKAKEDGILKWLVGHDSNLIMFHHRFPTSTVNVARAAHPHSTKDYFGDTQYIMVHNGVIRNPDDLWVEHQEQGIQYRSLLENLTYNDSEALLWDFALTMEGKQKEMKAYGDMAFICLKLVNGKLMNMYFGRNSRPLNMYRDKDTIELSSEGRGEAIKPDELYNWNYHLKRLTHKRMFFRQYKPYQSSNPLYSTPSYNVCGGGRSYHGEYDSYDDYVESNWERMRRKFGRYLGKDQPESHTFTSQTGAQRVADLLTGSGKAYEAVEQEDGSYIVTEAEKTPKIDLEEVYNNRKDYEPTTAEIQNSAMDYLIQAQGNFENAYFLVESDYADLIEDIEICGTFEDVRNQLKMEAVMEFINSDPEYENEKSVSSIWSALWSQQQTKLLTA